jgi:hypothetical protein
MKKYQAALNSVKPIIKDHSLISHEAIRNQITVIDELQDLIPPLLTDEAKQLEENIKANGCREALIIWETDNSSINRKPEDERKFILVDGHNRYRICQKNNIDFKVNLQAFDSLTEVRDFMINNQLGRRNLTPEQMSYLRGLKYLSLKQVRGKYERSPDESDHMEQNVPYASTADELGEKYNVSSMTVKRDAVFATGLGKLEPTLRNEVLSGSVKVNKKVIQELAKQDLPDNSIKSLDDIISPDKPDKKEIPAVSTEFIELKMTLEKLVNKLLSSKNIAKTCDEIIKTTGKIKQLEA